MWPGILKVKQVASAAKLENRWPNMKYVVWLVLLEGSWPLLLNATRRSD